MVGVFINTLPIRLRSSSASSLIDCVQELQEQQVQASVFSYTPLVDILRWSEVSRSEDLLSSIFVFENYPRPKIGQTQTSALQLKILYAKEASNAPLAAIVVMGSDIELELTYDARLYDAVTIRRMLQHWNEIFSEIVCDPERPLSKLNLTSNEELRSFREWNDTTTDDGPIGSLIELFEQQAARTPESTAVEFCGKQMKYRDLEIRSNQLARYLRRRGIGAEEHVALYLQASEEMVVGLLGIMKIGAVCVFLTREEGVARRGYKLVDSNIRFVLSLETWGVGICQKRYAFYVSTRTGKIHPNSAQGREGCESLPTVWLTSSTHRVPRASLGV